MDIVIRRRPVSIPMLPVLTGLVVVVGLFMTMRVGRIQGNEVGVLINNLTGSIDVRMQPGAMVYNGLITDFYAIDNTVQTLRMVDADGVNIKTMDGADVTLDVEINYRLVQDAEILRTKVVPECGLQEVDVRADERGRARTTADAYTLKWIRDYARSVTRYKFGELKTDQFYDSGERDTKARESVAELNRLLGPHGIDVRVLIPDRFRFYEEYESKIREKKEADQEVQSQREKARAALEDQARQMAEADAQVNIELEQAKGDLRKQMLAAEADAKRVTLAAEAYDYQTRTRADADLFRAKNEARSVLARAESESQGIRELVASLSGDGAANLVRLAYAEALRQATLTGVPYATDPVIQKVDVSEAAGATRGSKR